MLGYSDMRTDTKYNYFRTRPTLRNAGLSEALYRVGQLAAEDLNRQNPAATTTDAACPPDHDDVGEMSQTPAVSLV